MAATVSTGHHASLRVDLVPAEPPLRPRQGRPNKLCEHATKHDMSIEGSHPIAIQQRGMRRRSRNTSHHSHHPTYSHRWASCRSITTTRQRLRRPVSRSPRTEQHHLPRESNPRQPACYDGCHTTQQYSDSFVHCHLPPALWRSIGPPSTHPTRSEEICSGALMLSTFGGPAGGASLP